MTQAGLSYPALPRYVLAQKCLGIFVSFPVSDPGAIQAIRESQLWEPDRDRDKAGGLR